MRCKKHIADYSSSLGVCASCLRDRLFEVIEAQVQEDRRRRRSGKDTDDENPPPLQFPRSVSPYVSHRKSGGLKIGTWQNQHQPQQQEGIRDPRFFSTPQVGPGGKIVGGGEVKKKTGFGFKSKPEKSVPDPDRGDKNAGSDSRWWFVRLLFGHRRTRTNASTTDSLDKPENKVERKVCRKANKGMSPAPISDDEDDQWKYEFSGPLSEISKQWKETPRRTPVWVPPGKRGGHNRNGSGIGFCLSPLVRASPSRQWNQKGGVPPEMVVSGDMRVVPVKPSPSHPAAFNKNRSRKMADFGRCQLNR